FPVMLPKSTLLTALAPLDTSHAATSQNACLSSCIATVSMTVGIKPTKTT
ncbi:hypothetical protein NDU88_003778, partial [Pleurodeles waltl]